MRHLLAVFALVLTACGTSATCPTSNTLTYDSFGQGFLNSYCVSCHTTGNASDGVNLSSLSLLKSHLNKVDAEVASGAMPPKGSTTPSAEEKANLAQWLACGAP